MTVNSKAVNMLFKVLCFCFSHCIMGFHVEFFCEIVLVWQSSCCQRKGELVAMNSAISLVYVLVHLCQGLSQEWVPKKIIFLFNQNICYGYSKEPSQ